MLHSYINIKNEEMRSDRVDINSLFNNVKKRVTCYEQFRESLSVYVEIGNKDRYGNDRIGWNIKYKISLASNATINHNI